ncbi:MAG: NlpC/P60 family protein [Herminiimonas sp.]|nr:NlpC/P60 family protein [Herminiimonas sp.]MDB5853166.1 NlpC/P60 family protein [Herminiimonas sp.]
MHPPKPRLKLPMIAVALALAASLSGVAASGWSAELDSPFAVLDTPTSTAVSALQGLRERAADLAMRAMGLVGIQYKYGGNSPENGLDCSGLVRYVFKESRGANLPRTSEEISRVGQNVESHDLQPGDLVFYQTLRHAFSHVGIYLGDNKFIHSPASGGAIRIESMDLAYWKKRFNGARRINESEDKTVH